MCLLHHEIGSNMCILQHDTNSFVGGRKFAKKLAETADRINESTSGLNKRHRNKDGGAASP